MPFRTWEPFREIMALRQEVERAFEDYGIWRWPFSPSFLPALGARSFPLMNLGEDKDNVYIEALAPGLNPDTLEISVKQGQLRIAGEKASISPEVKPEAYHRNERNAGRFVRMMSLPTDVDSSKVTAQYKDGLLFITLPKAETVKPKQITVKVA
jgi:HSP20 family protein